MPFPWPKVLHEKKNEYDTCCFSPHNRHGQMLAYESNIRAELGASGRGGRHGWFTSAAVNHSKHEVAQQGKTVIRHALAGKWEPGACPIGKKSRSIKG